MTVQRNKIAYITGSSRGIGKALVIKLLDSGYKVVGIARTPFVETRNYSNVTLDLNDLNAVNSFEFEQSADEVLLINNAGAIGEILPVGQISNQSIQDVITINTIAPQILMNKFIKTYSTNVKFGHILNISSGAGKNPIDAWASYCASKAAIDLFSRTIKTEFQLRNIDNWYIHSIAPGVVDTKMQEEIRNADPTAFKLIDKFVGLKNNNELSSPKMVAEKLFQVISAPTKFPETIISVRDF